MIQEKMYRFYRRNGMTAAGAAAMLSMCQHESAFRSGNLEDRANREFNISDEEYTRQVDAGLRSFEDKAGYGFFQWTFGPRKKKLRSYAREKGVSIMDEDMQLEFSVIELKESEYSSVWNCLCGSDNVDSCVEILTRKYERPANVPGAIEERKPSARAWLNKFKMLGGEENAEPGIVYQSVSLPLLGLERQGQAVKMLQAMLIFSGEDISPDALGVYGEGTKGALARLQKSWGQKADGICGKKSYTEFFRM